MVVHFSLLQPPTHHLFDETPLSSDPMAEASGDGSMGDRISALPDEALVRVLSHLRSRDAVQTCVLSRRWRYLWRSVSCIDVSFEEFEDRAAANNLEREEMFKMFVNHLLILRKPVDLKEFRLEYSLAVASAPWTSVLTLIMPTYGSAMRYSTRLGLSR